MYHMTCSLKTSCLKILPAFLACYFFFSVVNAQTKKTNSSPSKVLTPVNIQSEPPNPYADLDKKALQIPDSMTKSTESISVYIRANFIQNHDKVRAAFIWVASNIRYDVPNMYQINYYEKM